MPLASSLQRVKTAYEKARGKRVVRWAMDALFIAVALIAVSAWQTRHHLASGTKAEFSLPSLAGATVTAESLRGKPTLLVFWAPWCTVCKAESSSISFVRKLVGDKANVLSVATAFDDPRQVKAFVDAHGVDYPVLLASEDVPRAFHVEAFPTMYFLDADGRVKGSAMGYTTTAGLLLRLFL